MNKVRTEKRAEFVASSFIIYIRVEGRCWPVVQIEIALRFRWMVGRSHRAHGRPGHSQMDDGIEQR